MAWKQMHPFEDEWRRQPWPRTRIFYLWSWVAKYTYTHNQGPIWLLQTWVYLGKKKHTIVQNYCLHSHPHVWIYILMQNPKCTLRFLEHVNSLTARPAPCRLACLTGLLSCALSESWRPLGLSALGPSNYTDGSPVFVCGYNHSAPSDEQK